jgi:hypothetical protein
MSIKEEITSNQKEALRRSPIYAIACGLAYLGAKDLKASERLEQDWVSNSKEQGEAAANIATLAGIVLALVDLRDTPERKRLGRNRLPGCADETDYLLVTFVDRKKLEDNWPVKKSISTFIASRPDLNLSENQLAKRYAYLKRNGLKVRDI